MFTPLFNKKILLQKAVFAIFLMLTDLPCFAQINYELSRFTNTYTAISTGGGATQITSGTGLGNFTSTSGLASTDEGAAFIPFPFSFTYNGTSYSTSDYINICTNGFISFYTGTPTNTNKQISALNTSLNTTPASVNALALWWGDLDIGLTGASVLYQVIGTTPDRRMVIQFTNVPTWYSGATKTINFQVVIYETGHTTSCKKRSMLWATAYRIKTHLQNRI